MIPEGYHNASVLDAKLAESKNGSPSINLEMAIDSGDKIWADIWLTDAAFERSIKNLEEVFGFDGDFERLDQLCGRSCQIKVAHEEWEGKVRAKVAYINPEGGRVASLNTDKAESYAKKFSLKARQLKKSESAPF